MAENKAGSISLESFTGGIRQYIRILQLTRKPSTEEFLTISKVAGAGIILIGVIGFIVYLIMVPLVNMLI